MTVTKPQIKLYEFWAGTWDNVPKLAQFELGYEKEDIEWISIDLLKINPNGTIPALQVDGKSFVDSITSTKELIRLAPRPPPAPSAFDAGLIAKIHEAGNIQSLSMDEAEHKVKSSGLLGDFFADRQVALGNLVNSAPAELREFYTQKQTGDQEFFDFYCGSPEDCLGQCWRCHPGANHRSAQENQGPIAAGEVPGEADFHVVTWLARTITNAGVAPNTPASIAIPELEARTGGASFDPVIAEYWDAWIVRPSFKESNVN
ncbi:hypothetical protein EHS25_001756 [Saitozyma podzolica]|uniref:GST N-terminal domain-containing protein n=1 Tax=Saitozyma podzolica TaxID=1890683 RepID=A0A427YFC8_9TREE|nr:hypothetical protein EHS25_001756 [Saitozyma podzolica]